MDFTSSAIRSEAHLRINVKARFSEQKRSHLASKDVTNPATDVLEDVCRDKGLDTGCLQTQSRIQWDIKLLGLKKIQNPFFVGYFN